MKLVKDGFGRTIAEVKKWKTTRVSSSSRNEGRDEYGGWNPHTEKDLYTTRCDIDIVDGSTLSWESFVKDYASCLKPVLIRGGAYSQVLQKKWNRKRFIQNFHSLKVDAGDIPYGRTLGRVSRTASIQQHYKSTKDYIFCQLQPDKHRSLLGDIPKHPLFDRFPSIQTQFYLGKAKMGAPMHMHIDAWNILVYGQKRWFIMPPFQGYYSAQPIMEWFEAEYPKIHVLECMQEAGDILYIPKYWSHAVLNTRESIGCAREFLNPYAV